MQEAERQSFISSVVERAESARQLMTQDAAIGRFVDATLPSPRPYIGTGDIKLFIIGQDPTVQREESRKTIDMVLNLNHKYGSLYRFICDYLCAPLGLSLHEHVYATNACKCFFKLPPTTILRASGVDVLQQGAPYWLPLLRDELNAFPDAMVISLGEPVMGMLIQPVAPNKMINYWGYHRRWRSGLREAFRFVEPEQSTVGRRIHPFVHQPTMRGPRTEFYRKRVEEYVAFIRRSSAAA